MAIFWKKHIYTLHRSFWVFRTKKEKTDNEEIFKEYFHKISAKQESCKSIRLISIFSEGEMNIFRKNDVGILLISTNHFGFLELGKGKPRVKEYFKNSFIVLSYTSKMYKFLKNYSLLC